MAYKKKEKRVNPNTYYRIQKITSREYVLIEYTQIEGEKILFRDIHNIVYSKYQRMIHDQPICNKEELWK